MILQAPNGWGKTTLLNAIFGLIPIEDGAIEIAGVPTLSNDNADTRAANASCVPAGSKLFPSMSIRDTAALASCPLPEAYRDRANRTCATLSGGERQRLALALTTSKQLNIYDEPLNGLDDCTGFVNLCQEQASSGQAVFLLAPKTSIGTEL